MLIDCDLERINDILLCQSDNVFCDSSHVLRFYLKIAKIRVSRENRRIELIYAIDKKVFKKKRAISRILETR